MQEHLCAREASSKILNGFACTNEAEASSKSSMAAMLVGHEPPVLKPSISSDTFNTPCREVSKARNVLVHLR